MSLRTLEIRLRNFIFRQLVNGTTRRGLQKKLVKESHRLLKKMMRRRCRENKKFRRAIRGMGLNAVQIRN